MTAQAVNDARHPLNRHILVGLATILLGTALFAAQRQAWDIEWWNVWWTLILLFMGLVRFIYPGTHDGREQSRRTGAFLMVLGALGFATQAELFGLDYSTAWPWLVILIGINIVWRALERTN